MGMYGKAEVKETHPESHSIRIFLTEEVFTMPHRLGVDGIVYASRPLDYNGVLIKDFYLRFENGKAVDYRRSVKGRRRWRYSLAF